MKSFSGVDEDEEEFISGDLGVVGPPVSFGVGLPVVDVDDARTVCLSCLAGLCSVVDVEDEIIAEVLCSVFSAAGV